MPTNKNIVLEEETKLALHRSQKLIDITKKIVKSDDNFVLIKAGSFMMGSDEYEDEQPIHKVTINYNFYMSKYQVTIKEYLAFCNSTNSHYPQWMKEGSEYNLETGDNDLYKEQNFNNDAPIIGILWEDTKAYCEWRSKKEGKEYRLPSEAEWEYACRAGTTTKYSFGDDEESLKEYAWYEENANGKAHSVGERKPNLWGLYDMHGNVWEWCEDYWSDNYDTTPRDGSNNLSQDDWRIVRGSSWDNIDRSCRSSYRSNRVNRGDNVGFRVVGDL